MNKTYTRDKRGWSRLWILPVLIMMALCIAVHAAIGDTMLNCDPAYCVLKEDKRNPRDYPKGKCREKVTEPGESPRCPKLRPDGSLTYDDGPGPANFTVTYEGIKTEVRQLVFRWCENASSNPYAECDDSLEVEDVLIRTYCNIRFGREIHRSAPKCLYP